MFVSFAPVLLLQPLGRCSDRVASPHVLTKANFVPRQERKRVDIIRPFSWSSR